MTRPLCECGNLVAVKNKKADGTPVYRRRCDTCRRKGQSFKGDICDKCGFKAENPVQLDVDHKDNNPANNDPSNLWTLCKNCHVLKTKVNRDWVHKSVKM